MGTGASSSQQDYGDSRIIMLEARVDMVDREMAELKSDMRSMNANLNAIKVAVSSLEQQTKTNTWVLSVCAVAIVGAVVTMIFQSKEPPQPIQVTLEVPKEK